MENDKIGSMVCTFQVRCRICGQTARLPSSAMEIPADTSGFFPESCSVVYQGLCPQCREELSKT